MIDKIVKPANTTQFAIDLKNVTYPKDSPDRWIEWGGSFSEVVPKEECLKYIHQNCTFWGYMQHITFAVCLLVLVLAVLYLIAHTRYNRIKKELIKEREKLK